MSLTLLNLELPPMSKVAAERRRHTAARRQGALRRNYAAAQFNRLTNDWFSSRTSANAELRRGLLTLRARSRELARNNDYIKKFLSTVTKNVIGPKGIQLQVKVKDADTNGLDETLASIVQEAFKDWSKPKTASANGKMSWTDQQKYATRIMARDGEFLARFVYADNPFGFSLHFIDVDWLDETFNILLPNGNRVLMSVEVDKWGRPVAYHLTPPSYEYLYPEHAGARRRERVNAAEIIHGFLPYEDAEQSRGVPWAHTAMLRLQTLGGYEEAELVAAQIGACTGVYLIPPEGDEGAGYADDDEAEGYQRSIENIEPGTKEELPPGYDVKTVDPNHPNTNYGAFQKSVLRGISSGLDVSYHTLSGDLEGVNYSSIRAGLLDERDTWRSLQTYMIEHFCTPVFLEWLQSAILNGAVEGVRASDFQRLTSPKWQPRGWDWVDPLKDMQAAVLSINNGLESRTDLLAERGENFEHKLKNLAKEAELAKKSGVNLEAGAPLKPTVSSEEGTETPASESSSQK
jgi:lambda family phage portal protein